MAAEKIGFLIPQFFFDVIGRIVPGFLILIAFGIVVRGPTEFGSDVVTYLSPPTGQVSPSSIVLILLVTAVSYGIAVLLSGFADIAACQQPDDFSRKYDFVKSKDASAGARIGKLNAEDHMIRVLIVGWLGASVLNFVMLWSDFGPTRLVIEAILILNLWSMWKGLQRFAPRRYGAVLNYAAIYGYKPSPKPTVAALLMNEKKQILLTQRCCNPFKGYWCLPGGHIDPYEPAREAIIREVHEETGLSFSPKFFAFFDEILQNQESHCVVLVYAGVATGEIKKQESEVSEAKWFSVANAKKQQLAFDHGEILEAYSPPRR